MLTPYKLAILGDVDVGKAAITIQLSLSHFVAIYDPTIEYSYRKQVVIDQQACVLEVLDTAGQGEHTTLRDQWTRDRVGFILVYSITSRKSFETINKLYSQVQRAKGSGTAKLSTGANYLPAPVSVNRPHSSHVGRKQE
ncbi:Ras family, other [Exophiala aquamarina CBS 119918]|uniref:Ras family, other n=1 Tax=Exophiala aquamarina CBS 119918 TaxID=1182545 RepID=A0A072P5N7_9EURO|nr:Ras family, other [Exophiala aquamarina CBS 119918]KEF50930.1 Ras family, other [Exophiala aquamarina CBS 119918]